MLEEVRECETCHLPVHPVYNGYEGVLECPACQAQIEDDELDVSIGEYYDPHY